MAADPSIEFSESLQGDLDCIARSQARGLEIRGLEDTDGDPKLFPYQRVAVKWLTSVGSGVLADEQGLGKTVMAVCAARECDPARALILCPSAKTGDWERHVRQWIPEAVVMELVAGPEARAEQIRRWSEIGGYLVSNYAKAVIHVGDLHPDLIIIDEAHKARNRKTEVSFQLRKICKRANWVFLMTASPTVNTATDIWPLLNMCDPVRFGSYWGFVFRFFDVERDEYGLKVLGVKDSERGAFERILRPYVLQRAGKLGLKPSSMRQVDYVLPDAQRGLYESMAETGSCEFDGEAVEQLDILAQITRLRQLALDPGLLFETYRGPSKLDALPSIVGERPGQVVVFTAYAQLADRACRRLQSEHISATVLTGQLSKSERDANLIGFQRGEAQVIVVTHGTGGEGLDLFQADRAVFLDLAWHPAGNEHAAKRILRYGQKSKDTEVIFLHSVSTIEDHVRDIVLEKRPVSIRELLSRLRSSQKTQTSHSAQP